MLENEKLTQDPHLCPNQHQILTTSRGSPIAHAYRVWSTYVNAFESYPAHRTTDRQTHRMTDRLTDTQNEQSHCSASLGRVIKIYNTIIACTVVQAVV